MYKSPSVDNFYNNNLYFNSNFDDFNPLDSFKTPTTSVKKPNYYTFEYIENLQSLPYTENNYNKVEWKKLSSLKTKFIIFPNTFKHENFNQGCTGLCFLFSCLASIATKPGLIQQIIQNNYYWEINQEFIVYLFHNKIRKEIKINDSFPFENNHYEIKWIWSKPADNELFGKIIEKAYLKYQLTYNYKMNINNMTSDNDLLKAINQIIFGGGYEKEAMEILVNTKEYKLIYDDNDDNSIFMDDNTEIIFEDIKNYIDNKKALVTLARHFDNDNSSNHAYSVLKLLGI